MALEIERKFLVQDESWRAHCTGQHEIRDGLVAIAEGRKVRVRICDGGATLTVKAKTSGLANAEFEYDIPLADAEELLAHHCLRPGLAKTRYIVPDGPHTWHVDVYKGLLKGVVLAEVELPSETATLVLPPWNWPRSHRQPRLQEDQHGELPDGRLDPAQLKPRSEQLHVGLNDNRGGVDDLQDNARSL